MSPVLEVGLIILTYLGSVFLLISCLLVSAVTVSFFGSVKYAKKQKERVERKIENFDLFKTLFDLFLKRGK